MYSIGGFLMAVADSVPGVSGGTIAFLLGFYDKFIGSLHNIISGNKQEKIDALKFLIRLGIGWIIGFLLAVLAITSIFESHIYQVSSLFLGFIIFSIPIFLKDEKNVLMGKYINLIFTLIGALLVVGITLLNSQTSNDENSISGGFLSYIFIFISAMLAISAMVLPGISGSTILLILGLYFPVITAVKNLIHFDLSALPIVIVFGFGVLFGIVSVVKIINICLKKFRSQTIYMVLGLMLGSLYSIVRGPETLSEPQPAMDLHSFSIIFFLIGGAIIAVMQLAKYLKDKKISKN